MTGERVRSLRKKLGMSQQEFADRLGIKRNAIANYEICRSDPVDSVLELICREFNVSRRWLETGAGEIFIQKDVFSLDDFLRERGADSLEVEIIKAYFELDPTTRHHVLNQFRENLQRRHQKQQSYKQQVEQPTNQVAEAEAEYIKSTSENVQKPDASASNTIDVTA